MLPRQQGRWCDNSNLFAGHCGNKGGAHRDFGFPEPDIATHQTVHRLPGTQITQHILNSIELVICFRMRKFRCKLLIKPITGLNRLRAL
ncbi:MAG: Uncharacterised protein [Hyphomonas sp. TMED17]|nr:MAG: Uncharacterised protein [Hyphomonas sp. TMED17]